MKPSVLLVVSSAVVLGALVLLTSPQSIAIRTPAQQARQPESHKPNTLDSDSSAEVIKGYKTWRKVNPDPMLMDFNASVLCNGASVPSQGPSPHRQKYVLVYVNGKGVTDMIRKSHPHFPVGSVIVKEKLTTPDSSTPELLTVMVKHKKGYYPESGDWEYMVFNGTGTQVTEEGKLTRCRNCHQEPDAMVADYVFRVGTFRMMLQCGGNSTETCIGCARSQWKLPCYQFGDFDSV